MKIVTVVGARPQFVKAAILSRSLRQHEHVEEVLVHTGQHYDTSMSQVFFEQLQLAVPKHNLQVGSGTHGQQTGAMMIRLEQVLQHETPDAVLVYGDTNSTLAAALVAVKLHVPVFHVEAGLRSYRREIPEEVNRVLTDQISTLLFAPTEDAVQCLRREGITKGVHRSGDVMYDCVLHFRAQAEQQVDPLGRLGVDSGRYILLTCHRPSNADDEANLKAIVDAANILSGQLPVVFPVHPRTRKAIEKAGVVLGRGIVPVEPVSYLEMISLESHAALIVTDSGGVQKEAFFCGVPCVTLRQETEWNETVRMGANVLAGCETTEIVLAAQKQLNETECLPDPSGVFGDGRAADHIARTIAQEWANRESMLNEHLAVESLRSA